jgi:hypothetical protein
MDDLRAAENVAGALFFFIFSFFHRNTPHDIVWGITGTCYRPCYLWCCDNAFTFSMKIFQLRSGMAVVVGDGVCVPVPILRPVLSCIEYVCPLKAMHFWNARFTADCPYTG